MIVEPCTWIGFLLILMGSIGNSLCICVFFRKRFRSSVLTPFFISLLIADCIYFTFRVIKLLYYQGTLFHHLFLGSSCSSSLLIQIYGYFTQHAPQILIPLCHYELYLRFILLLLSFLSIKRAYDMSQSAFLLIKGSSSMRSCSFLFIINAFIIAYIFEFLGLSIFCSDELDSNTAYQWYNYLYKNLSNETSHLINFMTNQTDMDCMINNGTICSHEQIVNIAPTTGFKMTRNELRLKYHYHTCLFRLQSDLFFKFYDILYSRSFGINRYTLILVIGSIIPSIITIIGNGISLCRILNIRNSINEQSSASRRRTDETHRVTIIITIECLLAIFNSWFIDIILSIKYCHHSVAIGDDCPNFLRHYHPLLASFDLLNSMSNILLYCFAGTRFRHELERMLKAWIITLRKCLRSSCHYEWLNSKRIKSKSDDEQFSVALETSFQPMKKSKYAINKKHEYTELNYITTPTLLS